MKWALTTNNFPETMLYIKFYYKIQKRVWNTKEPMNTIVAMISNYCVVNVRYLVIIKYILSAYSIYKIYKIK